MKKIVILAAYTAISLPLMAIAATFDINALGNQIPGGWSHKNGQAAEYNSSSHNYRIWKPEAVSSNADGTVFVGIKIDHIRGGGKDDHAFVQSTFSPDGKVIKVSVETKLHNKPTVSKEFGASAGAYWGPVGVAAGTAAATVASDLFSTYDAMTDDGGAEHLASVVEATIVRVSNSIRP